MMGLTVSEQSLTGNPLVTDPYPQTLVLTFIPDTGVQEIQIAPCWEGYLVFLADSKAGYPSQPKDVTPANATNWPLVGDLILFPRDLNTMAKALGDRVPLMIPPPTIVRYSKVKLTSEFLFTTLPQVSNAVLIDSSKELRPSDPKFHATLVIQFLQGNASIRCKLDPKDEMKDFALKPMPSVALTAPPTPTRFRVIMSVRATELLASWFARRPEDPSLPGTDLVIPSVDTPTDLLLNPAHPAHSAVPPWALFQTVNTAAVAGAHLGSPLWIKLRAPRPDGKKYRRIDLIRPPIPGKQSSWFPTRPYPLFQLAWQPDAGGAIESLRIPLNGRLYLPLADESYRLWVSPRRQSPPSPPIDDTFLVSVRTVPNRFIEIGAPTVVVAFGSTDQNKTIYAHLFPYDSNRIWEAWVEMGTRYFKFRNDAKKHWGLDNVPRWSIYVADTSGTRASTRPMQDYSPIHGFIKASAGRHGLAPEFLHAVVFGEGLAGMIESSWNPGPRIPYDPHALIDGFAFLGLDRIADTVHTLAADKYLDSGHFDSSDLTHVTTFVNPEDNSTSHTGDIIGWEAAIEFVAAELHQRQDWMLNTIGKSYGEVTELQRRFLAYVRYVSSESTSSRIAFRMIELLSPWVGPEPTCPPPPPRMMAEIVACVQFKTLQRIAVSEWYENAGVYR
jgi:hypothetical protein